MKGAYHSTCLPQTGDPYDLMGTGDALELELLTAIISGWLGWPLNRMMGMRIVRKQS